MILKNKFVYISVQDTDTEILSNQLVKALRPTLEEVAEADILIHVVDFSNPNSKQQIEVTNNTLREIGVENIPVIYAFNKIDLVDGEILKEEECVYISGKNKEGIEELVKRISKKVFSEYIFCKIIIPYEKGNILSYLNENGNVISTEYKDNAILISLECKETDYEKYKQYVSQLIE